MTRVKRGVNTRRRHQKMKRAAKGYRGLRSRTFKWAKNATMKAGLRSYTSRRLKKRDFRSLWITRINAGCRAMGVKYSRLIDAMTKKDMAINRKMLSELAVNQPEVFKKIVEEAMK
ncbi:50S ribosomal protein L20 [Candidatus Peregrinibacteria bacterium]|nr:50S ribosomal protein L20 [Candidatus Peregrinibacteria bacterium]